MNAQRKPFILHPSSFILMLTLGFFLQTLTNRETTGNTPAVSCVVVDSREVVPGSVFIALPGEKVDGHDYVAEAFAKGAQAAMVAREQANYPTLDLRSDQPPPDMDAISPLFACSSTIPWRRCKPSRRHGAPIQHQSHWHHRQRG
jgi:hypothetical protein